MRKFWEKFEKILNTNILLMNSDPGQMFLFYLNRLGIYCSGFEVRDVMSATISTTGASYFRVTLGLFFIGLSAHFGCWKASIFIEKEHNYRLASAYFVAAHLLKKDYLLLVTIKRCM